MPSSNTSSLRLDDPSTESVAEEIQSHPHLYAQMAENSLYIAESLRNTYLAGTERFIGHIRNRMAKARANPELNPFVPVLTLQPLTWADVKGEVVTFIDGGIGQVHISQKTPLLLRVGSYTVKAGERDLSAREQFGYYPIILGDLQGGNKERTTFSHLVRVIAELLGGIAALERTPDLRMLVFHGPLVYPMGSFLGHTPFTEADIDLFLRHYSLNADKGEALKRQFLKEATATLYPRMAGTRAQHWGGRRLFEPVAWIAFLLRKLIEIAQSRTPSPLIAGVVERGRSRNYLQSVFLPAVFQELEEKGRAAYFSQLFGNPLLTSPRAVLDRLQFTDDFILHLLLQPGEACQPWRMNKFDGLRRAQLTLPDEDASVEVDWSALAPGEKYGFPQVMGTYINVNEKTDPIRIETFEALGDDSTREAARRVFLYSQLLPGYGFPVGLDIVDRYAHVPAWLTEAYGKLIRYHLAETLNNNTPTSPEMRRLLLEALYMKPRDWLFRPAMQEKQQQQKSARPPLRLDTVTEGDSAR